MTSSQKGWQPVCATPTPHSLVNRSLKEVASADAAFFVPKLLQEREQCQDRLEQAQDEHEPIVFVHDITPYSGERRADSPTAARNISHVQKVFKRN